MGNTIENPIPELIRELAEFGVHVDEEWAEQLPWPPESK